MNDLVPLLAVAALLAAIVGLFIRVAVKLRRGGGSMTTVATGATYEFLTKDKKRAIETVVEMNSARKRVDPHTKESKEKWNE